MEWGLQAPFGAGRPHVIDHGGTTGNDGGRAEMAQSFSGADIGQLEGLAAEMAKGAAVLERVATGLGGALRASTWVGPDAEFFTSDWYGTHTAQLNAVIEALQAAATTLRHEADQQRSASDAGTAGFDALQVGGLGALLGGGGLARLIASGTGPLGGPAFQAVVSDLRAGLGVGDLAKGATSVAQDAEKFMSADNLPGWLASGRQWLAGTPIGGVLGSDTFGAVAKAAGPVGIVVGAISGVVDGTQFVNDLRGNADSYATTTAGLNTLSDGLGVAAIASAGCPPVALGLGAASLGIKAGEAIYNFDPQIGSQVAGVAGAAAQGLATGAQDVVNGAQDLVNAGSQGFHDVTSAVGGFISHPFGL